MWLSIQGMEVAMEAAEIVSHMSSSSLNKGIIFGKYECAIWNRIELNHKITEINTYSCQKCVAAEL